MRQQLCLAGALFAALAAPAAAQNPAPPLPPAPPRVRTEIHLRHGGGGFLGVGVEEIDHERAQALGLREEHGVEVKSVEPDSPAAKAGLKDGDVVLDYNGQRVEGVEQFTRMVGETPSGRQCRLGVWRNHAAQTLTATLATRTWPGFDDARALDMEGGLRRMESDVRRMERDLRNAPPMPAIPPMMPRPTMGWQMSVLGIEGEELNPQLAEFFGVKQGVLVRSVIHDSAAERSGLKAGDVITRVDGTAVTSPREISSLMRASRSKQTTAVTVSRARKELILEVKKGERSQKEAPEGIYDPLRQPR